MADDLERVLRGLEEARADKSGRWVGSYSDAKAWLSLVKPAPRK